MESAYETVLPNGMPLIQIPIAERLATAIAIVFPAGARHETENEVGAAHLLEHLAFKGTEKHPSAGELNRAAEYLGTELEGASSRDFVEFSTFVRAESSMPAIELLTELVATPLLAESEVENERAVVVQEIADAEENPGSRADDLLMAAVFAGHRLAKTETGTAADVRRLAHEQLLAFRTRQWSTAAGLVAIGGNLEHLDQATLEEVLGSIPNRPAPPPPAKTAPFAPRIELDPRDGEVAHLRLAFAVAGLDFNVRRHRVVAEVFSQLIGGPMGSRLFDDLREQHALCYWVDGYVWGYESTAFLSVGCSVRPSDLDETYERIQAILASLRVDGPTDEESRRFRAYSTGAAALEFESVSGRLDYAIELIMQYDDHAVEPNMLLGELESVTGTELAELAAGIDPRPCVGCVGPVTAAQFA